MKHLIICREYPPAPSGGIGTYVLHIAQLLADRGETVYVIGQVWQGAEQPVEEHRDGRLIVHRVPFRDWRVAGQPPLLNEPKTRALFGSGYHPQCFGWQATLLAEQLVEQHGIDVLEAQEFEAPLYYFQLRRALGLGPKRTPPCLVHLHSPTELIVRHNDGNPYEQYWRTAKRLERYTIAAADALLCPSRYVARQVERLYGLPHESVVTIPLPAGTMPPIERPEETWRHGSVMYVGRLERRKGILEWLQAAVPIARRDPNLRFEFVGANVLGSGQVVVPDDVKDRFVFHGAQPYEDLPRFLAGARAAVVPSRWENFPNVCVEAMCSGLPVLVSPEGGMKEIVEDGRAGWVTASGRPDDLAAGLERVLATPPERLASMGQRAREDALRLCDREAILERHLEFRREIVRHDPGTSRSLPVNLPWLSAPLSTSAKRRRGDDSGHGIAVVVTCRGSGADVTGCVESLEQQRAKPAVVHILDLGSRLPDTRHRLSGLTSDGYTVTSWRHWERARAKNAAIEAIIGTGRPPLAFIFLEAQARLEPGALEQIDAVFRHCPEVGVVSGWAAHRQSNDRIWLAPNPSFPYQWVMNEAAAFAALRTHALVEAGLFRPLASEAFETWDLVNAVMAADWLAVTVPEVLAHLPVLPSPARPLAPDARSAEMRHALLSRFPDAVARDAADLVPLTEAVAVEFYQAGYRSLRQSLSLRDRLVNAPRRLAWRMMQRAKTQLRRWGSPSHHEGP